MVIQITGLFSSIFCSLFDFNFSFIEPIQFNETIEGLKEDIKIIQKAKFTIIRSKNLKEVFGILLAFGNHCNVGNSLKGNAYGFDIRDINLVKYNKYTLYRQIYL